VSSLRSTLDEMRVEDLRLVDDEGLAADLDELERASRVLEAERSRRLAEFDRRRSFAADGYLSASAWFAHRHRASHASAAALVRRARTLEQMPLTREVLGAGEISADAVRLLASAREACPEAFAETEQSLVEAARTMTFGELRNVTAYWRIAADRERALEDEDRRYERRSLFVSPTWGGMVRVDGDLDPETGQTLITALRAVTDAEARTGEGPDLRSPAQRRADALGEVCRRWLASATRATVAGERPQVVVTVDLAAMQGSAGRATLEDAGPVTPETARRLACEADVTRVITGPSSKPLDVGRRTKVAPAPLRRAVGGRDGGCRFPGCERPPGWCDAHHVRHWADGGETSLANLVLLCRPHHRAIHRGFGVQMVDGSPVFSRPDGTALGERAPP